MKIIGLTGSIGMGKTTVANMFFQHDVPVYDADKAVHSLYNKADIVELIEQNFPGVTEKNAVNRKKLLQLLTANPEQINLLNSLIHPHLRAQEQDFIQQKRAKGYKAVILDIPLLFETGADQRVDYIIVVSAPFAIQKQRVLQREGMTEEKFLMILSKQMPNEEKCRRANFVIDTSKDISYTYSQVSAWIKQYL